MTDSEIQDYLRDNGYPEHLVRGGRAGLVAGWRRFVEEVERGYRLGLEDYRNDLDLRGIIAMLEVDSGPDGADIARLDERFRAMLTGTGRRVWESAAGDPFWYFGYPVNASGALEEDLKAEDLA